MEEKRLRTFVQVVINYYDQYQNRHKTRILNRTFKVNTNCKQIYQWMNDSVITKFYVHKNI